MKKSSSKSEEIKLNTREERIDFLMTQFSLNQFKKIQYLLNALQRPSLAPVLVLSSSLTGMTLRDISLFWGMLNSTYPSDVFTFSEPSSLSDPVTNDKYYLDRTLVSGPSLPIALDDIEFILEDKTKVFITEVKIQVSDELESIYPNIKLIDDTRLGKMTLVGILEEPIILSTKDEQVFILVSNVLVHHNFPQDIDELYEVLSKSKRANKILEQKAKTSAGTKEKKDHIISIVSETNRQIKSKNSVSNFISIKTIDGRKIKLSLNINLGTTSG
jgi:hypothetical protein